MPSEEADVKLVRVLRNPAPRPGRIWPSSLFQPPLARGVSLYSNSRAPVHVLERVEHEGVPRVEQTKRDDSCARVGETTWLSSTTGLSSLSGDAWTYFRGRCDGEEN